MGMCNHELMPELGHEGKFYFKITAETGMKGLCRFNISCNREDNDNEVNSQGADLFPEECRALAHMLISVAELIDEEAKQIKKKRRK